MTLRTDEAIAAPARPDARLRTMSVVIPALRWTPYLDRTLESIRSQRLDPGVMLDVTVALASGTPPPGTTPHVRVVENPGRWVAPGMNHAIAASEGAIVVRIDSRCQLPPGYLTHLERLLQDPSIGCAGGGQTVIDPGLLGSAFATAYNSPLLSLARYRWSSRSGPTDTVYLGAWRRDALEGIGGFNEQLKWSEDSEVTTKVRDAGLRIWYDGSVAIGYTAARSMRQHLHHAYETGLWRAIRRRAGERSYERRHGIILGLNLAVVAVCLAWLLTGPSLALAAMVFGGAYLMTAFGAGASARRMRRKIADAPPLKVLGVILGPAFGLALLCGGMVGTVVGFLRPRANL